MYNYGTSEVEEMAVFKTKRNINATEGPIFSQMILFAIPLMLTNIMQQLYSMADNIVVGKFSGDPLALAAVGSTGTLTAMLTHLFVGFSSGCAVVVAQSYGSKDKDTMEKGVHTSLFFAILAGLFFCAFGLLISEPALILLDTKDELLEKAILYFRVVCLGIPATAIYNFGASILRSVGDSKTPLYTLSASGIVNVLLNLVFVIVFKMSILGVAIATIASQYISAVVVIAVLSKRKSEPYSFDFRKLSVHKATLLRVLRLGVPAAVQGSLFSITNLCLIRALNSFPTPVVSARTIATNIDVILSTAINSYLHVTMTFTGQNLGAGKLDRIKKTILYSALQVTVFGFLVGQIMIIFYKPLVGLYLAADDPYRAEVFEAAKVIMTVMLSTYFIGAIHEAFSGVLRGLGYSLYPMFTSIGCIIVFRMAWIFFVFPKLGSLTGLYLVYPISWSLSVIALSGMIVYAMKKIKRKDPERFKSV